MFRFWRFSKYAQLGTVPGVVGWGEGDQEYPPYPAATVTQL